MKELKFNSQVCTTIEQSKRLLELRLNPETADMCWFNDMQKPFCAPYKCFVDRAQDMKWVIFPAWSLHRLMEIAMKGDKLGCITHNIHQNNVSSYYELVIASIENLIKIDEFNKDYLEEK